MIRMAGSVSKGWLARKVQVTFGREYYFDVRKRHATDAQCSEYVARELVDLDVFHTESNLGRRQWYSPRQVLVGGIQPNMIVGMLMGAEFIPRSDADADISPRCLAALDVGQLPAPASLLEHPLIRLWLDQIQEVRGWQEGGMQPIPPFFWDASGRAAVHGAVTSGLKFYGDEFLMELLTQPAESTVVVDWLTDVSAALVARFAEAGQMPAGGIHVGECAACMIDAANFRRYVVPTVSRLGERFGGVRLHSCGRSDHILEACRGITGLASLDVGGETSVAKIRQVFGPALPVGIAPLVEDMRANSPRGLLNWYHRVREENADGDLTIGFHLEPEYHLDNLRALHDAVQHS